MSIITNKNTNEILDYGVVDYMENGYPRVVESDIAYIADSVNVWEADIPDGVYPVKYCYTPDQGFYENPDYVEPNPYGVPDETVQAIKDDTILDLIELGVL